MHPDFSAAKIEKKKCANYVSKYGKYFVEKKTTLWIFFFFYVKVPRSANSSIQEYCNFKRKGSPLIENCQPTKFISLAEAVCRFQTNTPDRFHSRSKMGKKLFM